MSSTLSRLDGNVPLLHGGWRGTLVDYYELTKPRIMYLLLITTFAAMLMAAHGFPPLGITLVTLLGGGLAAGSAGAFNCVIDRDIDRLMARTMSRPIAAGRISPIAGAIFATLLGIISFVVLYRFANPLAAWLSLRWQRILRHHLYALAQAQNNAQHRDRRRGRCGPAARRLGRYHTFDRWARARSFRADFFWTPPHFWALALMANTDYHKAKVPMLPNVRGAAHTKIEIFIYTIVLVAMSLALTPLHVMGLWYFIPAAILGAIFIYHAWRMFSGPTKPMARITFKYSLLYLALMCVAMVADRVIG